MGHSELKNRAAEKSRGPLCVASLMEKKRDRCVWQKQRPLQRTAERLGTGDVSAAPRGKPLIGLHHRLKPRSAKRHHGFGGPASVTKVAVNFKIGVQRVGFNLCKSGLGAAYRARVQRPENRRLRFERRILNTHVRTLSPDACSGRLEDARSAKFLKLKHGALGFDVSNHPVSSNSNEESVQDCSLD